MKENKEGNQKDNSKNSKNEKEEETHDPLLFGEVFPREIVIKIFDYLSGDDFGNIYQNLFEMKEQIWLRDYMTNFLGQYFLESNRQDDFRMKYEKMYQHFRLCAENQFVRVTLRLELPRVKGLKRRIKQFFYEKDSQSGIAVLTHCLCSRGEEIINQVDVRYSGRNIEVVQEFLSGGLERILNHLEKDRTQETYKTFHGLEMKTKEEEEENEKILDEENEKYVPEEEEHEGKDDEDEDKDEQPLHFSLKQQKRKKMKKRIVNLPKTSSLFRNRKNEVDYLPFQKRNENTKMESFKNEEHLHPMDTVRWKILDCQSQICSLEEYDDLRHNNLMESNPAETYEVNGVRVRRNSSGERFCKPYRDLMDLKEKGKLGTADTKETRELRMHFNNLSDPSRSTEMNLQKMEEERLLDETLDRFEKEKEEMEKKWKKEKEEMERKWKEKEERSKFMMKVIIITMLSSYIFLRVSFRR